MGDAVLIVLASVCGVLLIACIVLAVLFAKEKNKNSAQAAGKVKLIDGVRCSVQDALFEDGKPNITRRKGDFVLEKGTTYTAKRDTALPAGSYTVLASSESATVFKLRVADVVREYAHGDTLVLAEGEKVCAVSCTVLLR